MNEKPSDRAWLVPGKGWLRPVEMTEDDLVMAARRTMEGGDVEEVDRLLARFARGLETNDDDVIDGGGVLDGLAGFGVDVELLEAYRDRTPGD